MKIQVSSAIVVALLVSACQTTAADPEVWVRTDGQRGSGNPVLEQQFQIDSAICLGQTQQSAVGMAPIYYRGIGGAIGASIIEGQRSAALTDVAKGCMAQRGYLRVPTSQALEAQARFAQITKAKSSQSHGTRQALGLKDSRSSLERY